jgi:MauM/NapG family ferredoxin protein
MKPAPRTVSTRSPHGRLRWTVQAVACATFVSLFALTTYPYVRSIPYGVFQKFDPLTALAAARGAGVWLVIALATILVTLLAGRVFCSYFCPLGFLIDLADLTIGTGRTNGPASDEQGGPARSQGGEAERKSTSRRGRESFPKARHIKYWVLGALCAGTLAGTSALLVLDPLSLLTRVLTVVAYPLWAACAGFIVTTIGPLAERLGWTALAYTSAAQPVFQTALANLVMLVLLLGLGVLSARFWCRYLCPLGALLGIFSRRSLVKRRVTDACIRCGRCARACPMDAVGEDPRATIFPECIACEACLRVCPVDAIAFRPSIPAAGPPAVPAWEASKRGLSRRGFLGGVGLGVCLAVVTRANPESVGRASRLIRPPGAIPEPEFLAACVRCGLCVRSCLTHTLQPAGMESGLLLWGTPVHVMRLAGCEQQCNLCGTVCPTGAIRDLPLRERQHAKVGTAVISQSRCVAWRRDQLCLLCDESCPYNAIVFRTVDGHKRPFVDESRCNGCGMCEHVCPVEGEAAIVVYRDGEVRIREGSYVEVLRQRRITLQPQQDRL